MDIAGLNRNKFVPTPHLDRLAGEGLDSPRPTSCRNARQRALLSSPVSTRRDSAGTSAPSDSFRNRTRWVANISHPFRSALSTRRWQLPDDPTRTHPPFRPSFPLSSRLATGRLNQSPNNRKSYQPGAVTDIDRSNAVSIPTGFRPLFSRLPSHS